MPIEVTDTDSAHQTFFYIYTSIGIVHTFIGLVSELLHSQPKGYIPGAAPVDR